MRTFLVIILGLTLSSAINAQTVKRKTQAPSLAVQISIADPCANSYHANLALCAGRVLQKTVETTQKMELRTQFNEPIPGTDVAYTVRTVDFY
jgi:hypothetical protein